ncbi:GGDEF domain-containing protein [Lacticaseibacillus pabuli]|uniref:GGDEF domain-containing protein n=1 Tax=Lacticaseibacillus pabuli TaxID=3025672 RepID=A0ABY7WRK5_9LACO|nr:GGDEF domain-containing protein [Lacticaseibacillus sp. KACC 23028]WDF82812.1 GGDEF domain-containing protein [Lacticaseibacillus sp. KACC 23028]
MIQQVLANIFLVVASTLGFVTVYQQIDDGTKKRVAAERSLSPAAREVPLVIYVCAVLLVLNFASSGFHGLMYWVFVNLKAIIMIYASLLMPTMRGFVIVQICGAYTLNSTGNMTGYTWAFYLLAAAIMLGQRWASAHLRQHDFLYLLPATAIGLLSWVLAGVRLQSTVALSTIIINMGSLLWAFFALWDYDLYQRQDQRVIAQLSHQVQYDGLTQVRNWPTFQQDFNHAYDAGGELALITLDIDHFKAINDTYGHLVGNQALMVVATTLRECLSDEPACRLYRTGGEEFAIIAPQHELSQATDLVLKSQRRLRNAKIRYSKGEFFLSASFGLAIVNGKDTNSTAVFKRADHYLYQSKRCGRDCVTIEGTTMTAS